MRVKIVGAAQLFIILYRYRCPLRALSGHRLVRCTCPLLTQSGHSIPHKVRSTQTRISSGKQVDQEGLVYRARTANSLLLRWHARLWRSWDWIAELLCPSDCQSAIIVRLILERGLHFFINGVVGHPFEFDGFCQIFANRLHETGTTGT